MTIGTKQITQQEKASRWDRLIILLGDPNITDLAVRHISSMRRATEMLLARREELPAALTAELLSYRETLHEMYLEAAGGFEDIEGIINLLPTYMTLSTVGELCQPDSGE